jgi:signal transduction histidine kinase
MHEMHEFMLHASHELKTPLTILYSEIESALIASNEQRNTYASQLDEIQRLTRIVEGLSFVARTNSGQLPPAQELVPFHEIVQEMAEDAVILGRNQGICVRTETLDPAWVRGDRHRLRQLLLNLVDNATKYNEPGGAITISSKVNDNQILFEIANTGSGIRSEDLPNIFKKFYRGKRSSDPGGVGLGLTIAQAIARAHHGDITVGSSRAGWTFVRASLPQARETRA